MTFLLFDNTVCNRTGKEEMIDHKGERKREQEKGIWKSKMLCLKKTYLQLKVVLGVF